MVAKELTNHVSVQMTLNDLERRDARGQIFRRISLITLVPFDLHCRTTKFGRITHVGEELISMGSAMPVRKGAVPQRSQFWGSLRFMHTPIDAQLPKFTWQHTWGGTCFNGSITPPLQGAGSQAFSNFGGFFLFMRIPFVAELPNFT